MDAVQKQMTWIIEALAANGMSGKSPLPIKSDADGDDSGKYAYIDENT